MYDTLIENALIIDGSGRDGFVGNVGISSDRIAFVGSSMPRGRRIIEGRGLILTPGFVDIHTHTDLEALRNSTLENRLHQGITTDLGGNCGIGTFPASPLLPSTVEDVLGTYPEWTWTDYTSFKDTLTEKGIGNNQAFLASHTALRLAVMGEDCSREASDGEIAEMCELLGSALDQGAYGFSTGLYYAPCLFASRKELERLLMVVAMKNKLFSVHHRCEGDDIISSVEEVLSLAKDTGVRLEISHLKTIGKRNKDKIDTVISMIEKAREEGVDVKFDQYPYTFGSTSLFSLLPPSILALSRLEQRLALSLENEREDIKKEILHPNGWDSIYAMVGPEDIRVIHLDGGSQYNGMTLCELAEAMGVSDPLDALFDVLSEETGLAVMEDETESEETLLKIMKHPLMCYGSDSLYSSPSPHPRSFHAAPHFLSEYVIGKKLMSLEEGIRRMTSEVCSRVGFRERGLIQEGYMADIALFHLDRIEEEGCIHVFVNGVQAIENGKALGTLSGRVL